MRSERIYLVVAAAAADNTADSVVRPSVVVAEWADGASAATAASRNAGVADSRRPASAAPATARPRTGWSRSYPW